MNTSRLLTLAEFLEQVPEERFNFDYWASGDLAVCGTKACALGWATEISEFKALGLKLVSTGCSTCQVEFEVTPDEFESSVNVSRQSAERFFDIDSHQARQLFIYSHPDYADTAKGRAALIRKFVEHGTV